MIPHGKTFLVLALLSAVILLSPLPVLAADTNVSIQPPVSTSSVGSFFDVFVDISNVTDLYAFQFAINFDPAVIAAISITEGPFLPTGGTTNFFPGFIDNTAGSITSTADTLTGAVSGVSVSGATLGTLADIKFQALSIGTSPIVIDLSDSNTQLLDSSIAEISFSSTGGSATIPEPSAMLLLGFGLMGIARGRKKG